MCHAHPCAHAHAHTHTHPRTGRERQTDRQTDRQDRTERQRDRGTEGETDRPTETDRRTDRQTHRQTDRQTDGTQHPRTPNRFSATPSPQPARPLGAVGVGGPSLAGTVAGWRVSTGWGEWTDSTKAADLQQRRPQPVLSGQRVKPEANVKNRESSCKPGSRPQCVRDDD